MSFENIKWIWKNGRIIPWADATVHVSAHGLHYGSGVFEGIRCYETELGPALFRLPEHLERFYASAAVYNFKIPYRSEELSDAICELISINEFKSCYIRPICYMGSGSLGVHPGKCPVEVAIMAWPWAAYLGEEGLAKGVRITVSPWRKFHSSMMPTTAKACGQYLNSILAVGDAFARGFDEALLLDKDGRLAEGSGENLFIIKNRVIFTNQAEDSILSGITRSATIEIAHELGYVIETRPLELNDLLDADEAFFTGTAAEITPIREVDGQTIGSGHRGEITEKIQSAFFEVVAGRNQRFLKWLHPVEQFVTA
ncbi:MAG TPA: branched-chain amino acid transaminase [Pyrinomonadaceae bacterium]|nr:branched-chain amino acid transaminase [Pyrinomonadaceae bacterium]